VLFFVLGFLERAVLWNFYFGSSRDSTWRILSLKFSNVNYDLVVVHHSHSLLKVTLLRSVSRRGFSPIS
jgi:hypothetical protein